ncbi:MAG: lysophospholipid acyltransferase family protein [Acidimicrobiales bacterium]|nr:1-acyl-sn-glycerol-3-phosphate acyltransferase [Acidimicrobiales bacterium]
MNRIRRFMSAKGKAGWWFYLFIRTSIRRVLYPYFRVRVVGREHLDAATPLIVAPTHRSNLDAPLLGAAPNWRCRSLSKESLFENAALGWVVTALGSFPVKRGSADREALRTAQQLLAEGERVLVFPEGTRQSGNNIGEIFDGTAYLASKSGARVVPIGIFGTEAALPSGAKRPRRSTVTIVVGEPMDPPINPDGGRVKREHLATFTAELRETLQSLMDAAIADSASR